MVNSTPYLVVVVVIVIVVVVVNPFTLVPTLGT
jgi:hypothetical protein